MEKTDGRIKAIVDLMKSKYGGIVYPYICFCEPEEMEKELNEFIFVQFTKSENTWFDSCFPEDNLHIKGLIHYTDIIGVYDNAKWAVFKLKIKEE